MKIDGLKPGQGGAAEGPGGAKRRPVEPGKSFADALKKAAAGQAGAKPQESSAPAAYPAADAAGAPAPQAPPPPADDHISTIRHRLQTGYYNSQKVEDAISDKLSGYFDELG